MRINEGTALVTDQVVLRPYRRGHVVKYHEWMSDEATRQATASELLTLEEEYEMQASWRIDADKLTFIVHRRDAASQLNSPSFLEIHGTEAMIGDVNLFLSEEQVDPDQAEGPADPDKEVASKAQTTRRAEVEIMIAERSARRQGYALSALRALLSYASEALELPPSAFFARIGSSNEGSIALFEKLGFRRGKYVAVFDEQQMDWSGGSEWGWPRDCFTQVDDPAESL